MKAIFRTLSFLPLTILAIGAVVAPVQAQSMQSGQTANPASTTNSSDRIGVDASDPYSEQVYSGSQNPNGYNGQQNNPMVNPTNNSPNAMQNRQSACVNSPASMRTEPNSTVSSAPSSTDRVGINASDPYSEQVYSGSQNPEMANGSNAMRPNQAACENQTPSASTNSNQMNAGATDRIGVDASDPYSEQVYSGSQNPNMNTNRNNVPNPNGQASVRSSTSSNSGMQQHLSQLQQMRYEVLDQPSR